MKILPILLATNTYITQAQKANAGPSYLWDLIQNYDYGDGQIKDLKKNIEGLAGQDPSTPDNKENLRLAAETSLLELEREKGSFFTERSFYSRRDMLRWVLKGKFYFNYVDYGCYCMASGKLNKGKPVDAIDTACRVHQKCYQCNEMDYDGKVPPGKKSKTKCDPIKTVYNYNVTRNEANGEPTINCNDDPNTCQRSVCECDKKFAMSLRYLEDVYNPDFKGDNFNYEQVCRHQGMGPGVPEADSCCGTYPDRFPYSSMAGRVCCENREMPEASKTYSPSFKTCCNGQVKAIGSC